MSKDSKFTTEQLKDIIHQYTIDTNIPHKRINFSELARYATENLKIVGIKYYHFSRNKEINEIANKYNTSLEEGNLQYLNDDSKFSKLDVKQFVKINIGNEKKLTFMLNALQNSQKHLYDRVTEYSFESNKLKDKLEVYKNKYIELKKQDAILKDSINQLTKILDVKHNEQLLSALASTGLFDIEGVEGGNSIEKLDDDNGADIERIISEFDIFNK